MRSRYIGLVLLAVCSITLGQGNGGTRPASQRIGDVLRDRSVNWKDPQQRAQAVQRMRQIEARDLEAARDIARQRGIQLRQELPGRRLREVAGLDENGELLFHITHNANAAISTAANLVHASPYSLDGAGLTVGVWDGGSGLTTHQEFNEGASSRITSMDGAAVHYHAAHVIGTIAAYGVNASAKGMVPAAEVDSYDWNLDESELTGRAATAPGQFDTKIYLSNHSYGYSYGWSYGTAWSYSGTGSDQNAYDADYGKYSTKSRNLDLIAYNAPYYLAFYSAGNENTDGPNTGNTVTINGTPGITYDPLIHPPKDGAYRNGFETIGDHGIAKNVMTIGAAGDAVSGGLRSPSSSLIASFSSTGPCDDGRIKPDVVGNGVVLTSCDEASDTGYVGMSGTSMSSPNTCGSAALLVDLYRDLFTGGAMRASTLKGLLIHSASDVGNPGPDYTYGWGYVDVKTAADLIIDHEANPTNQRLVEEVLNTSVPSSTYTFSWDGVSPIRATLCWTDPAGASTSTHDLRTPRLVNDLDLKIMAPDSTEYLPFVMPFVGTWTVASMSENATTGTNSTDNVEQVLIPNPGQSGIWQVVITHKGTLTNNEQVYSLLLDGLTALPISMDVSRGGSSIAVGGVDGVSGTSAGAGSQITCTISNVGGGVLELTTPVAISNQNNCSVTVNTQPAGTVVGGESTDLVMTVTPAAAGTWSFGASIANNDTSKDPYTWTTTGVAGEVAPLMVVTRDSVFVDNGETNAVSDTEAMIGTQLTYAIENLGGANLTLTTPISVTGQSNCAVTVDTQPLSSVAASGSTDLVLTVTPSAAGVWSATVSITNNDADKDPYSWTISGSALGRFTVTYDANNADSGTVPTDPDSPYLEGETVTVLGNTGTLVRTGFAFDGWNTQADGQGTSYAPGATFTQSAEHITLYAKWNSPPVVDAGTNQTVTMVTGADWTPAHISTVAWYDAADVATIGLNGSTVTNWLDKSGNGYHGIGNNDVTYQATDAIMNNLPSIGNSATIGDNGILLPSFGAKHVYVVAYFDDGTQTAFGSGEYRALFTGDNSGDNYSYRVMSNQNGPDWIGSFNFNDAGTYRNGATTSSLTALPMPATLWKLKASALRTQGRQLGYFPSNSRDWPGRYAEWIFTDGTEDVETEQKIEGYLAHKWGVETSLPSDHPYRYSSPGGDSATVNLSGTATDPEADPVTTLWTKQSGPSAYVEFADETALDTTASFSIAGEYTLRLTADDGFQQTTADAVITVNGLTYTVTYDGNGNSGGTAPVDASSPYDRDASVTVLDAGDLVKTSHAFAGWNTISNGTGTSYNPPDTFTINTNTTLYAQWTPNTVAVTTDVASVSVPEGATATFQVKLTAQPLGDITVTVTHTAGDTDISVSGGASLTFTTANWDTVQTVTLAAAEDDGENINGSATITCDADDPEVVDASVTATEADDDYTLSITAVNGTVTNTPDAAYYDHGSTVDLTVTPNSGFAFMSWSGDASGSDNPLTVTMDADKSITANFTSDILPDWADEFDGTGAPDPTKWWLEEGFQRNEEDQWYQSSNAWQEAGNLVIEGRRETFANPWYNPSYNPSKSDAWKYLRENVDYTSSSLRTKDLYSYQYGRMQVRAQIPCLTGMWPAIWTVGDDGQWPHNGECDIMEYYGSKILANCAVGTADQWIAKWDSANKTMTELLAIDPDWKTKYHVWTMQWDADYVRLYVDNILVNTSAQTWLVNPDGTLAWGPKYPFKQPHSMWLNLAIGGNAGGDPSGTAFPQRYYVDYVRVWSNYTTNSAPSGITLTGSVNEGLPAGTVVGELTAVDSDPAEVIRYTLVAGTGDTDNGSFEILPTSDGPLLGILRTTEPLDYTNGATRSIRVRATDVAGAAYDEVLTVNVHGDPVIEVAPSSFSVPEGGSISFDVRLRTLPASDVTVNTTWTSGDGDLSVADGGTLLFTTSNATNWQAVTIAAAEDADKSNGTAIFTCTDAGGGYSNATVTVSELENDNLPPSVDAGPDQTIPMSAGILWTPSRIATVAWYDADDSETVSETSGAVSQWNDKSGNGNHAQQATSEDQPTYLASDTMANNMASIGNGGSSGLIGLLTPSMSAKNVYVVAYYKDGVDAAFDGYSTLLSGPAANGEYRVTGTQSSADFIGTYNFNNLGTFKNGSVSNSLTVLPMPVAILKFKSSAARSQVYALGFNQLDANRDWQGAYCEWIFTDGTEDTDTQKQIEGYLAWKWGLQTSLPTDHPYYDAAPTLPAAIATLDGTVSDPEGDPLTTTWSKESGPTEVLFADAASIDTTATFTTNGVYTLRLTAFDGTSEVFTNCVISVTQGSTNTYTVSYDGNGADSGTVPASQTKTPSVDLTLASNTGSLARTGFTYSGWNTVSDGSGTDYAEGATYSIDADLTLYAKWTANGVAVITDVTGVSVPEGGSAPFQVKLSEQPTANVIVTVSRASGDTDISVSGGASLTFTTANWDTYQTVTLNAAEDNGDNINGSATITCDADDSEVVDASVTATEADDDYTLSITAVNGTVTNTPDTVYYDHGSTVELTATADAGYYFAGWTGDASGSDNPLTVTMDADKAITASFALEPYTVSYDANGATSGTAPASQSKEHGVDLTLAGNTGSLARTGFAFDGWNTASDGSGTNYAEGATYAIDADLTLYAKWNSPPAVNAGPDQTVYMSESVSWTPADMTLAAWYDASDSNTLTLVSGKVSQWKDKSGNNRHVTQVNDSYRPSSGTRTLNDLNALDFSSRSQYLRLIATMPSQPLTAIAVTAFDTTAQDLTVFDGYNTTRCFYRRRSTDKLGIYAGSAYVDGASTAAEAAMASVTFNGASSTIRKNGGTAAGGNPGTGGLSAGLTIGNIATITPGNLYGMDGLVCELVFVSGTLSDDDRQKVEGYLAHKWGLQTSLPTEHPYYDAAPGSPTAIATLAGAVSDIDGDTVTTLWTREAGPAAVAFADAAAVDSNATFTAEGVYTLRLTADDPLQQAYDEVIITVEATSSVTNYTVTYDGNGSTGGSAPVDTADYTNGATVTVIGNTNGLAKTGHTFADWNTAADGSGTGYVADDTFVISSNTTLYAQWTPIDCTVTFQPGLHGSLDEGTPNVTHVVAYGSASPTPPAVMPDAGYDFTVWDPAVPATITNDFTTTAQYALKSYTVTFVTDGTPDATLSGNTNQVITHGATGTAVTATAPSGYHFANWTLDAAAYSLDNPLAVSNVTASMTLVATFLANDAIAITAASAEKVYDGLPLTTNDYSYTGTLEAGHTLVSVTVAGSQTLVGVGTNVPSDAVIQDGSSNDVTHLYTITYFNGTLTVTKAPSTITVTGNASYVYNAAGQGPDAANVSGSTGDVTYSYEGTGGTSYGPSADKPVVVGTYQVVATVTEDANHFGAVSDALAFWITQATPTVTQWPSASPIIIGQALSASTLTNGSASVDGSFAFTNPEYVPSTGGFYSASATFTPTDTANYTTASGSVDVFVDASVVLPFEENFEGMNLGDLDSQNNWQAAGVVVQTNMVFEGTQAAEIVDGEGYMQREFVDSQTNVWTDFHYQPVFFAEEPTGLDPEATSMFYFNTNGHPVVYDGVTPSVISNVTVTNGDWVRVTVHSDYVAGTWDFYVNEAREAAGLGFYNAAATHYSRLTIKGAGSATVPLDAIVIDLLPPFDPLVYYTLLINSAHGTALPDVGEHSYLAGVEVTASISGSPETNGLTRYVYTGWTGSGSTPATGTETNVSFTITEDSAITWQWSTNYWIELNTAGE